MLIHTDTYIDYIRDVSIKLPATPFVEVEKRVDFSDYVPEGFGTADCIMIQGNTLFVIDFKYGKGVPVSAEENPQMMLYALGAYEACKILYPIERIRLELYSPAFRMEFRNGSVHWKSSCNLGIMQKSARHLHLREKESSHLEKRPVSSAGQRNNAAHDLTTM